MNVRPLVRSVQSLLGIQIRSPTRKVAQWRVILRLLSRPNQLLVTRRALLPAVLLSGIGFAYAKESDKTERDNMLKKADELFNADKFDELITLLKSQPCWYDDSECLWRVARCEYHLSKYVDAKNKDARSKLIADAYEHVKKSLELNSNSGPAHKWAAILLDAHSLNIGTKERIRNILQVRHHMEQSIKYSPTDPTAHYLLGEWHFGCYQVSWIERKFAHALFGKLPDADMEVALKMFEIAETLEPNFYSKNQTLLAKTLHELARDPERVKTICLGVIQRYTDSPKWDDQDAVKEATNLLKKYGVDASKAATK